ncbi:WD repeat-containing protein NFIA_058290 [Taphrina deformans PYCC 5710]|uniref:DNA damage-binding protein CMR1 n=1 Tax=Taphrina deformans (strain PYCC 5710 / ATCC 11124 / CBS 356.35 / IMI 108563 / JCM 9778 / NBRC 8474) TaxID=1097556 RepID=R4XC35_TAPDE|nr:WD repeat-containing protein NFIA_058290 [Taphrina deformans PYCC 5710]|eukprot:CCG80900.1 WD repeat-containing protein NFIA_058290 [Taphrina deformans PYCC 5710]
MNDYEQERLINIAKNEALLKEIGLTGIKPIKPRPVTPAKKVTPKKRKEISTEPVARRTSSRLSGIPADSEVARKKAEDQYEAIRVQEAQKRQRVPGPIDLSDVIEDGGVWKDAKDILEQAIKSDVDDLTLENGSRAGKELKQLRSKLGGLNLLSRWEPNQVKLTPERIYSAEMHPGHKKLVFAGDKLGHLGMWDVDGSKSNGIKSEEEDEAEDAEDPCIHHFKLHSRTITAMVFDYINASKLYTSSYDGSVRCLDLPTGVASEVHTSDTDQPITGMQLHPDGNTVYFSTLDGEVGMRDVRVPRSTQKQATQTYQLHDRKIGALGMHPGKPHLLVTSSLDRTMKIWDFRNIGHRRSGGNPACVAEHTARLSVSSAFFNTQGSIVATSYDDTLKVFDVPDIGSRTVVDALEPDVSIRHNNQTGRWLTVFKAAWQQRPADGIQKFVVGNMTRKVDMFDSQGQVLAQLQNEYISAVPAVVAMHPSQNWVIAANASGKGLFFS